MKAYFITVCIVFIILMVQFYKRQFKAIWIIPIVSFFWPVLIVIGLLNKPKDEQKIANAFSSEGLRFAQIFVKEKRSWDLGTKIVFQARGKGFKSDWMSEHYLKEYLEILCSGYKVSNDLSADALLDQLEGVGA